MYVAKMLTSLTRMIIGVVVMKPLIAIVGMCVMSLVKGFVTNGLRHALHGHEEHSDNHRFENDVTHSNSLHKAHHNVQIQFTHPDFLGRFS